MRDTGTAGGSTAPTFLATASFRAELVDAALPYLLDVVNTVGLDAETGADVVIAVFDELRSVAAETDTPEVGLEVALRAGSLTVMVHQHLAGPARATDSDPSPPTAFSKHGFAERGYARHSVSTWVVHPVTSEQMPAALPEMDRAAVLAALSAKAASGSGVSGVRGAEAPVSLQVDVGPDASASIREQVRIALRTNAVADALVDDVELLVGELVDNVIRHEHGHTVKVDVSLDVDRGVGVTVTGAGVGASDPVGVPGHRVDLPDRPSEAGRGLRLLDQLASAWGTRHHQGATTVWFTISTAEGAGVAIESGARRPDGLVPMTLMGPVSPAQRPAPVRGLSASSHAASAAVAAAVVAQAEAVAVVTEAQQRAEPDALAVEAATMTEQAALDAAVTAADAAKSARLARAVAATVAAAAVADEAARTVQAVQQQADDLAVAVAAAASEAALTVSSSVGVGSDVDAARAAVQLGATVISAAVVKAEETARAAVLVARAVAAAAEAVAATTAAEAAAVEDEVVEAAAAVQAVATSTARNLAIATNHRAEGVALATRLAADASERLREANRQLQRAGRHDRSVALALQEAMLTRLPESKQLQLAARYLTAAEQDQVGGDWYDALVLPTGSTALVIGDVVGHDIAAAAIMGQLRNLLRGFIWDRNEWPSAVMSRLDRAMRDLHIDTIATAVVVTIEQFADSGDGARTITWTNAGHPAPILVLADGTAFALDPSTDVLLGVLPTAARRDHRFRVPAGSTLLLYTDGLIETSSQDLDTGQRRLLEAARRHYRLEPGELLDAIVADIVGDRPADDVAVLAVRFHARDWQRDDHRS